jgi:hypothetical protein
MKIEDIESVPGYRMRKIKCCITCKHHGIHSCDYYINKDIIIATCGGEDELGICDHYKEKK